MSLIAKTVCVTGASGYIASWLVKFLLHRGYTVKASVRDPSLYLFSLFIFFTLYLPLCFPPVMLPQTSEENG